MKPVLFHAEAEVELDGAVAWYEAQSKGLGLELQEEIEASTERIQQSPRRWPRYRQTDHRVYFVPRFPYILFYRELPQSIWIVAVAHVRRRPGYWIGRLVE